MGLVCLLFAYGCMGRGAIHNRLTAGRGQLALQTLRKTAGDPTSWPGLPGRLSRQTFGHETGFWRRVYADASDAGAFREWLYAINEPRTQNMVFEDPRPMSLHDFVGLYTSRVVYLYSAAAAWDAEAHRLSDMASVGAFYHANCVLDRTIRTERIAADLAIVMADLGRPEITDTMLDQHNKTNASKRANYERYYSPETIALVAKRDRLVIDSFGYKVAVRLSENI